MSKLLSIEIWIREYQASLKFLIHHGELLSWNTLADELFSKRNQERWSKHRDDQASNCEVEEWRGSWKLSFTVADLEVLSISKHPDSVRFEDFVTDKDGKIVLNIIIKDRRRYEAVYVDEETFEAVRGLNQFRLSYKKQQYETKRS